MNRLILTTTLILGLFSCRCSNDELIELQSVNAKLHHEIDSLKAQAVDYKFMPIVYPKSTKIKVGEKYEAILFIGAYSDKQKPITILYQKYPEVFDTLIYNKEQRGFIFTITPSKKGHYNFAGIMKLPTLKKVDQLPFKWSFDVE
jgi:hypothetical protein